MDESTVDITIIGAGFAGSLAALCLNEAGFRVRLVEKECHPRFAIGESSTPIADMILRELSDSYHLPWLKHLSRYGSWQKHYPDVTCGIKRGFSYYRHQSGQPFQSTSRHSHELLVAASSDSQNSDTNWLRSDVDALLADKVIESGISYHDRTEITSCRKKKGGLWEFVADTGKGRLTFRSSFFIDATGSPSFLKKFLGIESVSDEFETNSIALYSHFEDTERWSDYLAGQNIYTEDYPYNPDQSALHHLLDEGWMWMLRFNNDLLSAGILFDLNDTNFSGAAEIPDRDLWIQTLDKYPSLRKIFSESRPAGQPGKFIRSARLQRRLTQIFGEGWIALNHTSGFIDPLHSTGIAHTLVGLEKILGILNNHFHEPVTLREHFEAYQSAFFRELELIDLLVAGCYQARRNFPIFTAFSMLYFTCTIQYEQQRLRGTPPAHFLDAGNEELFHIAKSSYDELQLLSANGLAGGGKTWIERIRRKIEPYNSVGLLDDSKNNMYTHTAVTL